MSSSSALRADNVPEYLPLSSVWEGGDGDLLERMRTGH